MKETENTPLTHPDEQAIGDDGSPKFGRLLIFLVAAVLLIVGITLASEAFYS